MKDPSSRGVWTIFSKNGEFLFSLESPDSESKTLTAKELYDLGYQWFEPEANKYLKLRCVSDTFTESKRVDHFTWNEIIAFSEKDWDMIDFRQEGDADWKYDKKILIDVEGTPYWADALGQIPFAISVYREKLRHGVEPSDAKMDTVIAGVIFGNGKIFSSEHETSKNFDNMMILRGVLFASKQYGYEGKKNNESFTDILRQPVTSVDANYFEICMDHMEREGKGRLGAIWDHYRFGERALESVQQPINDFSKEAVETLVPSMKMLNSFGF